MIFKKTQRTFIGELLFIGKLLTCLFSLGLLIAGVSLDLKARGYLFVILQFLCAVTIVAPLEKSMVKRGVAIISITFILGLIVFGIIQKSVQPKEGQIYRPSKINSAVLGGILEERDLVLIMARFLPFIGGISFSEAKGLVPELVKSYDEMESEQGSYSSLLFDSLAGMPYFVGSEILTFNAKARGDPKSAVVFLHGTGGNFVLLCWIISKGSESIGAATFCPTLNVLGNWGSETGRKIVSELISDLRSKGTEHIYLVGLSAGAVGVGQIASSLANDLAGAGLLFGGHPAIRTLKKPILFMYGKDDERFPVKLLSWVANASAKTNPQVTINIVDGGHFFALQHKEQFLELFKAWLIKVSK